MISRGGEQVGSPERQGTRGVGLARWGGSGVACVWLPFGDVVPDVGFGIEVRLITLPPSPVVACDLLEFLPRCLAAHDCLDEEKAGVER